MELVCFSSPRPDDLRWVVICRGRAENSRSVVTTSSSRVQKKSDFFKYQLHVGCLSVRSSSKAYKSCENIDSLVAARLIETAPCLTH